MTPLNLIHGTARLYSLLFFALLATAIPDSLHAFPSGSTPGEHGASADFEKRLEKLQSSYNLFPLNETFKHDLAEAYASIGSKLLGQRQYERADENFTKALELYPDEAGFALPRGICNYYLKKYDIARYELERTLTRMPNSTDALYYLGLVMYETDFRHPAITLWEQALKLSPGRHDIIAVLEKARRETAVEAGMDRSHSSRFNLTYDPGVDPSFAMAVLDVLENAANQVGAELGHFPQARVPVAIYKRDDYKNVTNSPDWSGGVYDGTIRLPFGALGQVTPPIRAILYHEYAHVVVFDLTRGACPVWLNEGIAEMFGRQQFASPHSGSHKGTFIDFRTLAGGFSGLSSGEATRAYQQSFSMVDYLVRTYGWHRVKAILVALGSGMNIDRAIASALQDYSLSYEGLISEWRESEAQ
jgi:tetratricopeptide (TPR) repeat protein